MRSIALLLFAACGLSSSLTGQEAGSGERSFIQITPQDVAPSVRAIVPINDSNVFFLNRRGQIGVAKFSPGLSLIAWEYYSEVKQNAIPSLALGPRYSVVTASPGEITQAFDTDQDVELDFFQALIRDWPGRSEGVTITAGPIADSHGRLLFALSPYQEKPETEEEKPSPPKARLVAWHPEVEGLIPVTESQLQIADFAIGNNGLLAARLDMPNYKDGYYISLTQLPPFDPATPEAVPSPIPFTMPSLLIPAELTRGKSPEGLCFVHDKDGEKLLATCPESKQLIEILLEKKKGTWQGAILLNQITASPLNTIVEMAPGALLAGGDDGFHPLADVDNVFRMSRVSLVENGIVLDFTDPVDRFAASKPESYSVRSVSLQGGETNLTVQPVIESDGRSLVLKTPRIESGTVLRIVCQNVPSESGKKLLSSAVFYTVHQR